MEARTLKVAEYEGCPVCIRGFGNVFEYVTFINGQIYAAHIVVTRGFFQWLLGRDYTEKQLADVTAYLLGMAQATIETVKSGKDAPTET